MEDKNLPPAGGAPTVPATALARGMRALHSFLTSVKLALALLIVILACCIVGVTIFRGGRAGEMIFGTLWFNGLLVLLVVNIAFCFFGRIRGRKLTLIFLGMILFHLSFVAMLLGIVYNGLFFFQGTIRLTEGETLPSGDLASYDRASHGPFFLPSRLRGETRLVAMLRGYQVRGENKQIAYDIEVGDASSRKRGIIYLTRNLDHRGFRYLPDKEGYSVLTVLSDAQGRELYGAFVPLQSIRQKDDTILYTTGTAAGPGVMAYPPPDSSDPVFALIVNYRPSSLRGKELNGETLFRVWPADQYESWAGKTPLAERKVPVGTKVSVGDRYLSVKEVRYWAAMTVRYDPGLPIVLGSFWASLGGMIMTFIGRMK